MVDHVAGLRSVDSAIWTSYIARQTRRHSRCAHISCVVRFDPRFTRSTKELCTWSSRAWMWYTSVSHSCQACTCRRINRKPDPELNHPHPRHRWLHHLPRQLHKEALGSRLLLRRFCELCHEKLMELLWTLRFLLLAFHGTVTCYVASAPGCARAKRQRQARHAGKPGRACDICGTFRWRPGSGTCVSRGDS